MDRLQLKEKYRFHLKFTSYNPEDFQQVSYVLQRYLAESEALYPLDGYKLKGPIPIPRNKKLFTVNRSHHVHKKSQEQFLLTTYKRVWILEFEKDIKPENITFKSPSLGGTPLIQKRGATVSCLPTSQSPGVSNNILEKAVKLPWCIEEASLWNIIKGVRMALEPLEGIPGISMHWKGSRVLGELFSPPYTRPGLLPSLLVGPQGPPSN